MSARAWLGLADLPAEVDPDGVLAEASLRATLWPRLVTMTRELFAVYPPEPVATDLDHARWARVLGVCAAIDAGQAETALDGLAGLERMAGVRE